MKDTPMNPGQKMFHDFFMNMVRPGLEAKAEEALAESFARQAAGTFDAAYMQSIRELYFSLIRPECADQLQKAMAHFASNL